MIAACNLMASPLHAENRYVDEAPPGFIHLVEDETDKKPEFEKEKVSKSKYDIYISASKIGMVTLGDFGNGNFEVLVTTTVPAPPSGTMRYSVYFSDKEKAQACVKKILGIMSLAAGHGGSN